MTSSTGFIEPPGSAVPGDPAYLRMVGQLLEQLPGPDRLGVEAWFRRLAERPDRVRALHERYYRDTAALWSGLLNDRTPAPLTAADEDDPRFRAPEWRTLPFFRFLRASYAINEQWLRDLVRVAELPDDASRRLDFAVRQLTDAMSPANFAATNPEVIRVAIETGGRSLERGMRNLAADVSAGDITRSEPGAFEVGRNLAITAGAVVHENAVAQLIRYRPFTEQVRRRPLLIIPPFINKYYILDLQPENSFVRYALEQGLQVFLVSWRNPTDPGETATWDDYVAAGVHEMIEVARELTASRSINTLGFCVGGTLLATALAVHPQPRVAASLTLLAALLDFEEVGEIGNYIDEDYVGRCERDYAQRGLVAGAQIAGSFASLRANDLVWPFVVNGYLKGVTPRAFDLLHWNADSTNVAGPLFAWYLRNAYLENRLVRPGAAAVLGRPVDLSRLTLPTYVLATREDHIVPWRSAYLGAQRVPGTMQFVLGSSGHVAGVVNPPAAGRRQYWTNASRPADPDAWLLTARRHAGSWWTHWGRWMAQRSGPWEPSPAELGNAHHRVLEPAPGRYVRVAAHTRA